MVRILTLKWHKLSQSYPVLIRQISKKLQSDAVLIRTKLASGLIQSDPALSVLISAKKYLDTETETQFGTLHKNFSNVSYVGLGYQGC